MHPSQFLVLFASFVALSTAFNCPRDGYVRDPNNCAKFYICGGGEPVEMSCPEGLYFNEAFGGCDSPANVPCDNKPDERPPPPPTDNGHQDAGGFKVVCYFTNWSTYRKEKGKYTPGNIDPSLCTHITYAFAVLDERTLSIKPHDSDIDVNQGFYRQVTDLKKSNPSLKVMLAIGGWADSAGPKYSHLVSSAANRQKFISNALDFLKKHNFDGLDLDWEYPACPQGKCGSSPSDKANFALFCQELRDAFDKQEPRLLLSAAVGANPNIIENAYDVASLAKSLDHINIMAYDYHGSWEGKAAHHSALYMPQGDEPSLNADATVKLFKQKGAPASKLVLGTPAYGRSFTLVDPSNHGLGAPISGSGVGGEYTEEPGNLAYYEICERLHSRAWNKDVDANAGSYAYKDNQWVGYDDPASIAKKAKYVKDNGLGGAMIWDMTTDDFTGACCGVKNPLLNAINNVLRGRGTAASAMSCK